MITKRFIEWTEPNGSPVDGWTGPTGRSGPVFKTMVETHDGHHHLAMVVVEDDVFIEPRTMEPVEAKGEAKRGIKEERKTRHRGAVF